MPHPEKFSEATPNPTPNPAQEKAYYTTGLLSQQASGEKYDTSYVIDQIFTYHAANPFTQPKFEALHEAAKYFAKVIVNNVPAGADRTAAIRKLHEAVMTATAGISLGGLSL